MHDFVFGIDKKTVFMLKSRKTLTSILYEGKHMIHKKTSLEKLEIEQERKNDSIFGASGLSNPAPKYRIP